MPDLKEVLGEELYNQVVAKAGENKIAIVSDGNWFPKDKFDAVNTTNKDLTAQLKERDKQLTELAPKAAGNEALLTQINDLKALNEKTAADYQAKIEGQAFDFSLTSAIAAAKGKNPKAISALLDRSKLKLDGEKILGLDDQLKALKASDVYLFDVAPASNDRGANPGGSGAPGTTTANMNNFIRGIE